MAVAHLVLVRRMGDFLDSLSLGSGALLIAIVSALLAFVTAWLPAVARWAAAVVLPFSLSYCCYWLPVWLGGNKDQRSSWELLVVSVWWFAGLVSSGIVTLIVSRYAKRNV